MINADSIISTIYINLLHVVRSWVIIGSHLVQHVIIRYVCSDE